MSFQFIESFDLVSNSSDLTGKGWTFAEGALGGSTGRFGGQGYSIASNDNNVLSKAISYAVHTTVSFYFKNNGVSLGSGFIVGLADESSPSDDPFGSEVHAGIAFTSSGEITLHGDGISILDTSPTGVISPQTWHHIECQFEAASSGTSFVYVDGVLVATATGDFRALTGITFASVLLYGDESTNVFDDVIIQNGSSQQALIGDHQISVLFPDADTAQADWTGAFTDIDDPIGATDGDTTFITATTLNDKSEFDLDDLSTSPITIHAVQTVTEARKTDAGSKAVTPYILSGSTREDGTEFAPSETYGVSTNIHELNPDTAAAWTEATVNALVVGVEITI